MARIYVPSQSPLARAMRGFGAPGVKPTVPVEIDWSHPLARNLFSFIIVLNDGSVFDLVSRRLVGEPSNTASEFIKRPVGKEGICYGTDTNSLSASFHTLLNADADTWDSATLACRRWSQRFDQSSYLLRVQNANAFTALTLRTATNETINLAVENNLSMLSRRSSATSFSGFKWRTFAGDWDGSDGTINLYIDGQDDSAAGYMNGPNSGSVTNPTDRVIGIGPQKWHDKEFDSWVAVWRNRVLSAEQHRQIDENIYQLLKPANAAPFLVGTAAAGGPISAPLTVATETDSAVVLSPSGTPLTAAAEVDAGVALSAALAETLTAATESDAAISLAAAIALTVASETDSAVTLSSQAAQALVVATETDAGLALSGAVSAALSAAPEADQGVTLDAAIAETLTTASETDSAVVLVTSGALTVATETDAAIALAGAIALTAATETDAAVTLTAGQALTLGVAGETDSALTLSSAVRQALAVALEVDVAQVLGGQAALDVASEIDAAVPLVATGTHAWISGNRSVWVLLPRRDQWDLAPRTSTWTLDSDDPHDPRGRS